MAGRQARHQPDQLVVVFDVLGGERGDIGPTPRVVVDQALVLEQDQGLAQLPSQIAANSTDSTASAVVPCRSGPRSQNPRRLLPRDQGNWLLGALSNCRRSLTAVTVSSMSTSS